MPELTDAHRQEARRVITVAGFPPPADPVARGRRLELVDALAAVIASAEQRGPVGVPTVVPTAAADRVEEFLAVRSGAAAGLDPELIHVHDRRELRASDLRALVAAATARPNTPTERLRAALAEVLEQYDAACDDWTLANSDQHDAPDASTAMRYSDRLETAAHRFAALLRPALEETP